MKSLDFNRVKCNKNFQMWWLSHPILRRSYNGNTLAFQARAAGSIPARRSIFFYDDVTIPPRPHQGRVSTYCDGVDHHNILNTLNIKKNHHATLLGMTW